MIKYYYRCIMWLWNNRNWQNSRQKWKAMDKEVREVFDIDQSNIYSYKGKDYPTALRDYLRGKGLNCHEVLLEGGLVKVWVGAETYTFPQFAQWWKIAKKVREP